MDSYAFQHLRCINLLHPSIGLACNPTDDSHNSCTSDVKQITHLPFNSSALRTSNSGQRSGVHNGVSTLHPCIHTRPVNTSNLYHGKFIFLITIMVFLSGQVGALGLRNEPMHTQCARNLCKYRQIVALCIEHGYQPKKHSKPHRV